MLYSAIILLIPVQTKAIYSQPCFQIRAVAKGFTCGSTKCSYIICFGVAPYMKAIPDHIISSLYTYVALFDESFNKSAKEEQMDLHVRFWNKEKGCVVTCYCNSEFLGKASALDLHENFISSLPEIEPNKLLQVSSDGPNVNLAFLDILIDLEKIMNSHI